MHRVFSQLSVWAARATGTSYAFVLAVVLIAGWAAAGPWFGWSDSHSLFINTTTTVVTFLQVFLLQHAQTRDTRALHAKLDSLLGGVEKADERLIGLENQVDDAG